MSAYLSTLVTDIRTLVAATWTDTPANGIWEVENLEMMTWDDTSPPFAFIMFSPIESTDEYGGANAAYIVTAHIGYVGITTGDSSAQRTKGEALRDVLLVSSNMPHGTVLDVTSISYDNNIEPNKYFVQKDYTHRAVVVTCTILVGDILA